MKLVRERGTFETNSQEDDQMKRLLSLLVIASATVSSQAADVPTFSGKYQIKLPIPGHDKPFLCIFTQNSQALGGYCATELGNANLTGKFDGRNVSWTYTVEDSGHPTTVNYNGTLEASGKVSGSMRTPRIPVGVPFTAIPSK
jgi:hypothetical protein